MEKGYVIKHFHNIIARDTFNTQIIMINIKCYAIYIKKYLF